jgi:hypothetical protein
MESSPAWNFHFKLTTKTITEEDILKIDNYICFMSKLCFYHLQNTPEINRNYSLSVFLLHYFLNKLLHFRTDFHFFIKHYIKIEIEFGKLLTDITKCQCIYCNFPNLKLEFIDQSLQQYFTTLLKHTPQIQNYMLSVLEKCFELRNLHSLILQIQYPHLSNDTITHFVVTYKN